MMRRIYILSFLIMILFLHPSRAQEIDTTFRVPFDFELLLSGNFGELRSNHFHAGLDFKTQGAVGRKIMCVADGYISRASVSTGGYGLAIYVQHDNGYMTVYGHLDRFPEAIAKRVRDYQYENETYSADISFKPGEFPIKRGEVLAYAGNSGYSFGPHLHFEVRNSTGDEWYDPMRFYKGYLKDSCAPKANAFIIYPMRGSGVADGKYLSKAIQVKYEAVADTVDAWGWIGLGVRAFDYMDGTNNKYGVYGIELRVDGKLCFSSKMDRFSSEENRLINAWTDYRAYVDEGKWCQRMYLQDNNPLRALEANENNGLIYVGEERLYKVECRLSDYHGNSSDYSFYLRGRKQDFPVVNSEGVRLHWYVGNSVEFEGLRLDIPGGELFESIMMDVDMIENKYGISGRYLLGESPVPLWHGAVLSLEINEDAVADKSKLYIESFTKKGCSPIICDYKDGHVFAEVKALTGFEVAVDTVAPELKTLNEKSWSKKGKVLFSVKEKETFVKSFRGTLNGKFVLFSYNVKNGRIELDLKKENIRRGEHLLRLEVADACGNRSVYEKKFKY